MERLWMITLIGFAAGMLGTGIGGIGSFFLDRKGNRFMSFILEFSAGLMMAVVCFDLLPHAFELGGLEWTLIGIVFGVAVIVYLDNFIKTMKFGRKLKVVNSRLLRVGMLMIIGVALHNFPEGVAIGSGFDASVKLGISLTFVIAVHNIPEGLAVALPMKAGGLGNLKVFIYTLCAGIPMGIGAFIGAVLGEISQEVISICLGFAGGAMLYIVCGDLIPESKNMYKGRLSTIGNILGIILGIIISVGTH
ncbi:ZIP family metal transporter [Petroclostridium sp. X23]|uniref:ZIP family metal transporter n=1 Tax=Petroclostridium sp. X23 TaxID=3045146 RepID=UPI0024AD924B|nr:ZIP family metal transporter [Petroclostridium sp. X23]WHH57535.1 ZIP family metal transporter [Petroclostridium sp. X23]